MAQGLRITGGRLKGRLLKTGQGPGYRPATGKVREALFSMLEARGCAWSDMMVLDLFAGSGSLGFEAISRGARSVWMLEKDPKAAALIRENAKSLDVDPGQAVVVAKDLFRQMQRRGELGAPSFELVFIDPPYGKGFLLRALKGAMQYGWVADEALVVAEIEHTLDIEPEAMHPDLELLADRRYGQTRILIWKNNATISPSTQEHSTP